MSEPCTVPLLLLELYLIALIALQLLPDVKGRRHEARDLPAHGLGGNLPCQSAANRCARHPTGWRHETSGEGHTDSQGRPRHGRWRDGTHAANTNIVRIIDTPNGSRSRSPLSSGAMPRTEVSPVLDEFGVAEVPVTRVHSINLHFRVGSLSNLPVLDQKYRWIFKYTSSAEVRRLLRPSIICPCCAAVSSRGATTCTNMGCIVRHTLLLTIVLTTD